MISFLMLAIVPNQSLSAAQTKTLSGWLSLIYGDPPAGSALPPQFKVYLTDKTGATLAELKMDEGTARQFRGQQVSIGGTALSSANPDQSTIAVQSIQGANAPGESLHMAPAFILGHDRHAR